MKKEEIQHELLVIGGGAAGMMAAISAARAGADTAILEHTDKIGKKLLMTGNGRCNLTNYFQRPDCYRSSDPERAWKVLRSFTERETTDFFQEIGLLTREKAGYVYPYSNQASSVLRVLKAEMYRLHIPVYYRTELIGIQKIKTGFVCNTTNKNYRSKRLILAAGSKAAAKTGSDGSGYELARKLGHSVLPVLPALVQLTAEEDCFKRLSGIRTEGRITLYIDGKKTAQDTGELQLTEYGISGIPVFQVSRYAAEGILCKSKVSAELDFCPVLSETELEAWIEKQKPRKSREILSGIVNDKLAEVLAELSELPEKRTELLQIRHLVRLVKRFPVTVTGTKGFEQCQVCMGGVPLSEIDPATMESVLTEGLYLAGEILDVDGICGGYNLQWAWTSGHLAGASAGNEIRKDT